MLSTLLSILLCFTPPAEADAKAATVKVTYTDKRQVIEKKVVVENGFLFEREFLVEKELPSWGSGVVVKSDEDFTYILTCRHCVKTRYLTGEEFVNRGKIVIEFDKKSFACVMADVEPTRDLCLLKAGKTGLKAAVVAKQELYVPTTQMILAGHARGGPLQIKLMKPRPTPELVKHIPGEWVDTLGFEPSATPGESGCGLFRETDGHLIGIVFARSTIPGQDLGMATRLNDIRAFLKRSKIGD